MEEIKERVEPASMAELSGLLDIASKYWEQVKPEDYSPRIEDRLPRGYKMTSEGTYTFTVGEGMVGMAVIFKGWVSIQILNRTEAVSGEVMFVGRKKDSLIYWECKDGRVEDIPSDIEVTRSVSPLHIIIRADKGSIELLDVGDEPIVVTRRYLKDDD